ncbi:ATP-binding protein [Phytohabitans sp. LJ34]|uniref:ATP-binding protein n=1 Tax=Phytohabitans sp. LJ34 TaxID=3452217 RepID=UPI003F88CCB1
MGSLPRPDLPDGPARDLFDELHDLHHEAGWPSLRDMAKEVGCSHTTVSAAFSGPRPPRWGLLELIVEALGGDTERFHQLWLAASAAPDDGQRVRADPLVPEPTRRPVPPRELPGDVAAFTGRADQLAHLDGLLDRPRTAVVVSAVCGTAGVGKTALAVHWAHRVADRFPDGQLYVNLRGYDPERPMRAAEALGVLLRALGVEDAAMPHDVAERAARYRTLASGRRMLILLDNVHSVDQVRDLLPGTGSCLVVVTSRASLPALVARHGAERVNLDLLPRDEAVALLRTLIGARVEAEPAAAVALASRCARLPLALRIAAELAVSRPAVPLAALVGELGDESRRLDLLAAGEDGYTAVRSVFSWSCRYLDPAAMRAFQLLGLHPGQDVGVDAAAALLDTGVAEARARIDALVRAHLVGEYTAGRFGMHDLLRAYAAERAASRPEADRRAALDRLSDHYLRTATAAVRVAFPTGVARPPAQPFASSDEARSWLDTERSNLLAVADGGYASQFSAVLAGYLEVRAHYADALTLHDLAYQAACAGGDRVGEAAARNRLGGIRRLMGHYGLASAHYERALALAQELGDQAVAATARYGLGTLCWRSGRLDDAREHLAAALACWRGNGDRAGEGAALYRLGTVFRRMGRYRDALDHHLLALATSRAIDDQVGASRALNNLGSTLERMGDHAQAFAQYQRSLAICRELGNRVGVAVALTNLGNVNSALGRFDEALHQHQEALPIYSETGNRVGQGEAMHGLGLLYYRWGRYGEAAAHLRQAAAVGHELGDVDLECTALIDLADTLRAAGDPGEAAAHYQAGLALADHGGDRYLRARALTGLAHLRCAAGDTASAERHHGQALAILTDLGLSETHEARASLAALRDPVGIPVG